MKAASPIRPRASVATPGHRRGAATTLALVFILGGARLCAVAEKTMTPDKIAEARNRARQWKPITD